MSDTIQLHKLTYKRRANNEWVAAHEPTGSYALLDEQAKTILQELHNNTIQEVQTNHPDYDVHAFVEEIKEKGLVHKQNHQAINPHKPLTDDLHIPKKYATWTKHPLTRGTALGILLTGLYLLLTQPQLVPTTNWFFATNNYALLIPLSILLLFAIQTTHELAHYLTLKATGHAPGIRLEHRWHFIRVRTNINNAQLLTKQARNRVYLAGITTDLIILTTALILTALTNNPYAQLTALLSFLHALSQLAPHKEADLMRVASHQTGVPDITQHFKQAIKSLCPLCKQPKDKAFHRHAAPLLLFSTLALATLILVYALPIVGTLAQETVQTLLQATNQAPEQLLNHLAAFLLLALTAAYSAAAQLADHPHNNKSWFRSLMNATVITALAAATLAASTTATALATTLQATTIHAALGILHATAFTLYTKHYNIHPSHELANAVLTATTILLLTAPLSNAQTPSTLATSYAIAALATILASRNS